MADPEKFAAALKDALEVAAEAGRLAMSKYLALHASAPPPTRAQVAQADDGGLGRLQPLAGLTPLTQMQPLASRPLGSLAQSSPIMGPAPATRWTADDFEKSIADFSNAFRDSMARSMREGH